MTQREILEILRAPDVLGNLGRLKVFPRRKVIQGLFSALCHPEEEIKRRAVTAMGIIVADYEIVFLDSNLFLGYSLNHQ